MYILKFISFFLLLTVISCKKESIQEPVNKDANQEILECATCPSSLYQIAFESIEEEEETICDDFTDITNYPFEDYFEPTDIGYTQGGSETIVYSTGDFVSVNAGVPGIYGGAEVDFSFDGNNQIALFKMYGIYSQFSEMGFRINDSDIVYLDGTFPMTVAGVAVDIDLSPPNDGPWEYFNLTFTGTIDEITHVLFESGITELCVTKTIEVETPIIDKSGSIYYSEFYDYDGTVLGYYANYKTPSGYYGNQGVTLDINYKDFLAYTPSKISFVHAHLEDYSKLINVKLPTTPLIVTIPDSLAYYLSPYGYEVEIYHQTDGYMWINSTADPIYGALVDSIIIKGNDLSHIQIGANLQYSELRSLCTYYQ